MQQQPKNRTVGLELTTSTVDIYVVPNNYETETASVIISNATGSKRTFSLEWYDSINSTTYVLAEDVEIEANAVIQITQPLWLRKGDKLSGSADADTSVTVSVVVSEYFIPLQF
jgi:hypothetical protein